LQDHGAIHIAGPIASPWIRISKYTPVSWPPPLAPACPASIFTPIGEFHIAVSLIDNQEFPNPRSHSASTT
jgi:hypothetical protein